MAGFGEVGGCGGVRIHVHTRFSVRVCVYTACVRVYIWCVCLRACMCVHKQRFVFKRHSNVLYT